MEQNSNFKPDLNDTSIGIFKIFKAFNYKIKLMIFAPSMLITYKVYKKLDELGWIDKFFILLEDTFNTLIIKTDHMLTCLTNYKSFSQFVKCLVNL